MSTAWDDYQKTRNANLFISNNANPYMISPYSPTQISQTTGNNILAADIIKAYSPGRTIQVKSPLNCQTGLFINNFEVFNYKIYTPNISLECEEVIGSTAIIGKFNGESQVIFSQNEGYLTNGTNNYKMSVNGQFGQNTTLEPVLPAKILQGYVPYLVNGIQYYLPVYS